MPDNDERSVGDSVDTATHPTEVEASTQDAVQEEAVEGTKPDVGVDRVDSGCGGAAAASADEGGDGVEGSEGDGSPVEGSSSTAEAGVIALSVVHEVPPSDEASPQERLAEASAGVNRRGEASVSPNRYRHILRNR